MSGLLDYIGEDLAEFSKRARLPKPKFHTEILISDSGWIKSIQYDPGTGVLDAHLLDGSRYRYRGVPSSIFAHVVTAKSPGAAFNALVKGLPFTRLPLKR